MYTVLSLYSLILTPYLQILTLLHSLYTLVSTQTESERVQRALCPQHRAERVRVRALTSHSDHTHQCTLYLTAHRAQRDRGEASVTLVLILTTYGPYIYNARGMGKVCG